MSNRFSYVKKCIAGFLMCVILFTSVETTLVFALTSGPIQPEFASFSSAVPSSMVDTHSGGFNYNIPVMSVPGPHGVGYDIGLSYQSGIDMESESSWVGVGWSLNTGAISRAKHGFPDDFNGMSVVNHSKDRPNTTVTAGLALNPELFSTKIGKKILDKIKSESGGIGLTARYNSYQGLSLSADYGIGTPVGEFGMNFGNRSMLYSYEPSFNIRTLNTKNELVQVKTAYNQKANTTVAYAIERVTKTGVGVTGGNLRTFGVTGTNLGSAHYNGFTVSGVTSFMPAFATIEAGVEMKFNASVSTQIPNTSVENKAYGYLYSANAGSSDLMDYHTEKGGAYSDRDQFLGIPFADADVFSVMGSSMSGSFRFRSKKVGTYHPERVVNVLPIVGLSPELEGGVTNGGGVRLNLGTNFNAVFPWDLNSSNEPFDFQRVDENVRKNFALRMYGDLGGNITHIDKDQGFRPVSPELFAAYGLDDGAEEKEEVDYRLSGGRFEPKTPSQLHPKITETIVDRNTMIDYHFNKDILTPEIAFEPSLARNNGLIDRTQDILKDQIGEISICDEQGVTRNYGLPVYSKKEYSYTYDIPDTSDTEDGVIAYRNLSNATKTKLGQQSDQPYASQFLLTSMASKDYRDLTGDGPSADDIGGWVKFDYKQVFGSGANKTEEDDKWFNWRSPYVGLSLSLGENSTVLDDRGSASGGQKEIYYPEYIETATHVAKFVTSNRLDAYQALSNEVAANTQINHMGVDELPETDLTLQKLDKVILYKKAENYAIDGEIDYDQVTEISSANFVYDYSLCQNVINSKAPGRGKLTLKRVWFEYFGARQDENQFQPYSFNYSHSPDGYAIGATAATSSYNYPEKYDALRQNTTYDPGTWNPNYHATNTNYWGGYDPVGGTRSANRRPGENQKPQNVDPAPWSLKGIMLPSGGQIHVQYERGDYAYVQNMRANAFMKLGEVDDDEPSEYNDEFYLTELPPGVSNAPDAQMSVSKYAEFLSKELKSGPVLFKIKYQLLKGLTTECNYEYIEAYLEVNEVTTEGAGDNEKIRLSISKKDADNRRYYPTKICDDYYFSNRRGNHDPLGNCNAEPISDGSEPNAANLKRITKRIFQGISIPIEVCSERDLDNSYIRLPVPLKKIGGSPRVKRVLAFDDTFDFEGDLRLTGHEFLYQTQDNRYPGRSISSGVASNEPGGMREENVLVGLVANVQGRNYVKEAISTVTAGRNRDQKEGPYGESLLPGAKVSYGEVRKVDINHGHDAPGFEYVTYCTYKDYPTIGAWQGEDFNGMDYTSLRRAGVKTPQLGVTADSGNQTTNGEYTTDANKSSTTRFGIQVQRKRLAQGYSFLISDLPGKPLANGVSVGDPYDFTNEVVLTAGQRISYFLPDEEIPISNAFGQVEKSSALGWVTEVVTESFKVMEHNVNVALEVDVAGSIGFPFINISAMPGVEAGFNGLSKAVVTTIHEVPSFTKSITTIKDGVASIVENEAFDPKTGQAIVTSSRDSYYDLENGYDQSNEALYHSHVIPAHREYDAFAHKAHRQGVFVDGLYKIDFSEADQSYGLIKPNCNGVAFRLGDILKIMQGGDVLYAQVGESNVERALLHPVPGHTKTAFNENIQTHFNTFSVVDIIVERSALNNMPGMPIGNISTYGKSIIDENQVVVDKSQYVSKLNELLTSKNDVYGDYHSWGGGIGLTGSCDGVTALARNGQMEFYPNGESFNKEVLNNTEFESTSNTNPVGKYPIEVEGWRGLGYNISNLDGRTALWTSQSLDDCEKKQSGIVQQVYLDAHTPYYFDLAYENSDCYWPDLSISEDGPCNEGSSVNYAYRDDVCGCYTLIPGGECNPGGDIIGEIDYQGVIEGVSNVNTSEYFELNYSVNFGVDHELSYTTEAFHPRDFGGVVNFRIEKDANNFLQFTFDTKNWRFDESGDFEHHAADNNVFYDHLTIQGKHNGGNTINAKNHEAISGVSGLIDGNIEDGKYHDIRISYNESGIEVFFDGHRIADFNSGTLFDAFKNYGDAKLNINAKSSAIKSRLAQPITLCVIEDHYVESNLKMKAGLIDDTYQDFNIEFLKFLENESQYLGINLDNLTLNAGVRTVKGAVTVSKSGVYSLAIYGEDSDGNKGCSESIRSTSLISASLSQPDFDCAINLPNGGAFGLSNQEIVYIPTGSSSFCAPITIPCLNVCGDDYSKTVSNVLQASATKYSDDWQYDPVVERVDFNPELSPYQLGLKGNYRPQEVSVYHESDVVNGTNKGAGERNYLNAGTFKMEMFDWYRSPHENWVRQEKVNAYSPHGHAIENENALGQPSSVLFGYEGDLPYMVGQNTHVHELLFESFEYAVEDGFGSGLLLSEDVVENSDVNMVHSGNHSLKIPGDKTGVRLSTRAMGISENVYWDGVLIKFWAHAPLGRERAIEKSVSVKLKVKGDENRTRTYPVQFVARSGEWALFEVRQNQVGAVYGVDKYYHPDDFISYHLQVEKPIEDLYIDDFRIQPLNSSASCTVYDSHLLRPVASFDDMHFGKYYQYNLRGQLIRTLVETERGKLTVAESNINIRKMPKSWMEKED